MLDHSSAKRNPCGVLLRQEVYRKKCCSLRDPLQLEIKTGKSPLLNIKTRCNRLHV